MKPDDTLSAYGSTKTILNWCEDARCRVKASEFVFRLRARWSPERALSEPSAYAPKKSLFKGVTWNACRETWLARICEGKTVIHLGSFHGKRGEIQAALAYDRAAVERGLDELNFPAS